MVRPRTLGWCIAKLGDESGIEEYYWDRELVGRFETLWSEQRAGRRPGRETLSFIAERCCEGDMNWARGCVKAYLAQRGLGGGDPG